ncbi:MAG TPA: 3-isopropylmalate dehydratase small subunit [Ideonella sp.]|uniref:3-isopropylmalate dehydratase small subunit n=1 Tax=Ideonella sp. TaxID=1929293 RepID=UPI002E372FAA|nr:3-isopropylmalate dehydratase small subunit [Ideonella sp.]HEX5686099.1 3-isopropylmalate dehydratase small subunit [Ideonella sp.]
MKRSIIEGRAAALPTANLDTDQILPKQFLRGIDKAGLARGLLYDLRFDAQGRPRDGFVLNQPGFTGVDILIAGPNCGCGSSREHAVWGMQQFGFKAVVASSFGEIFYSNAVNNGLLPVMVSEADALALLDDAAAHEGPLPLHIDLEALTVTSPMRLSRFTLSPRHQRMLIDGLDMIGASLQYQAAIDAFAQAHWAAQPWLKDVAARMHAHATR